MQIKIISDYAHLRNKLELINFKVDDNMAVCEILTSTTLWSTLTSVKRLGIKEVILTGLQEGKSEEPKLERVPNPESKSYPKKVWNPGAGQFKTALDASGEPILTAERQEEVPPVHTKHDELLPKHERTEAFRDAPGVRYLKNLLKIIRPWS